MNTKLTDKQLQTHKKMAIDLFNGTWDLIDKENRTEEENLKMLHMAHASRYHWGECGTDLEKARGEWQVSRVYSLLKLPVQALYHAQKSLEFCLEKKFGDFDLAFAYEAITRAYDLCDDAENKSKYYKLAENTGEKIKEKEDRDYFFSELNSLV